MQDADFLERKVMRSLSRKKSESDQQPGNQDSATITDRH